MGLAAASQYVDFSLVGLKAEAGGAMTPIAGQLRDLRRWIWCGWAGWIAERIETGDDLAAQLRAVWDQPDRHAALRCFLNPVPIGLIGEYLAGDEPARYSPLTAAVQEALLLIAACRSALPSVISSGRGSPRRSTTRGSAT
ncbi:hypothetical protein [Nonomuraea typhae]|uniref:hypothetical protein n=1 Tax=Nonomuraea typhae TaxID=2603600 RepID=UPI0012FC25BB|nr:hypothetical protein [Nonomuraea typhae]